MWKSGNSLLERKQEERGGMFEEKKSGWCEKKVNL